MDAIETIKAKRAEYQQEAEKLQNQLQGFLGAVAACDDILKTLESAESEGQNGE